MSTLRRRRRPWPGSGSARGGCRPRRGSERPGGGGRLALRRGGAAAAAQDEKITATEKENVAYGAIFAEISGGVLSNSGIVEVVSSLNRDGSKIEDDLRYGVYVVFKANSSYVSRCFREYGVPVDNTGEYAALWRPVHLIGLELGYSVARALLDKQPTGATRSFKADAVAVAKKDLFKSAHE